ncbi:MAG: hypothetical protein ACRDEA_20860, partial [Microcystaceae cyanobacterium]
MFSKLFGGKKSDSKAKKNGGHVLELDEKESNQPAAAPTEEPAQAVVEKMAEPESKKEATSIEETQPEPVQTEASKNKKKKTSIKDRK